MLCLRSAAVLTLISFVKYKAFTLFVEIEQSGFIAVKHSPFIGKTNKPCFKSFRSGFYNELLKRTSE